MSMENDSSCAVLPPREQVLKEVIQIVAEFSAVAMDDIREHHTIFNDLNWDSLDVVECAMELEEHFEISVPDEVTERIVTVGDIVDGVLELLSQPQKR